jgi:mannitol operon repressor
MNMRQSSEPEMNELSEFLYEFNKESDRGATLNVAAVLDDWLQNILEAFFVDNKSAKDLIGGFNAPLGTFASKATAAHALGLIQDNEFREITLIRKIRNEFGHSWKGVNFDSEKVLKLVNQLPWCGPAELEETSNSRARFNAAIAILLTDLMWRSRLIKKEKLKAKVYPNKMRN